MSVSGTTVSPGASSADGSDVRPHNPVHDSPRVREFTPASVRVLAGSTLCAVFMPAGFATTVFPVVMPVMAEAHHWSRAEASFAASALQIGVMINSPLMGMAIRHFGAKRCSLPALAISGLFLSLAGWLGGIGLAAFCGAYGLIGLFTAGLNPAYALVSGWFHRQRALAFGIVAVGGTSMIMFSPQIANALIGRVGPAYMYGVLGAAVFCMIPVFGMLARERKIEGVAPAPRKVGGALAELVGQFRHRTFWLLALAQAAATGATSSTIAHSVAMMTDHGFGSGFGTNVVSTIGLGALISSALSGVVLDRWNSPRAIVPFALMAIIGLALLQAAPSEGWVLAGGMLIGLGAAGEASHLAYFVTRFFGRSNYSQTYGALMPVITGISAVIPVAIGASFDSAGSYRNAYWILEALYVLSVVLFCLLGPYRYAAVADEHETAGIPIPSPGDTR